MATIQTRELARVLPAGYAALTSGGAWVSAPHLTYLSLKVAEICAKGNGRLMVLMPVRHGKSYFLSRYVPGWWLGKRPDDKILLVSYSLSGSRDHARKARDLFTEWAPSIFDLKIDP